MKMNTPNKLTVLRILLVPVFIVLLMMGSRIGAGIVFIAASLTDTLDGYLARKNNEITVFGKFMDPLADKLLVCSALICLCYLREMPYWVVIIIVGRDFIISGFRLIAAERGIVIAANMWGKVKTVVQMVTVIVLVFNFGQLFAGTEALFTALGSCLIYLSAILTVVSLVIYLKDNIGVLKDVE